MQIRTNFPLSMASLFLLACGSNPVNVGTVPVDPGASGTDGGEIDAENPFEDYGSTDIEHVVTPIACDGTNSASALALFKYAPGYQPDPAVKLKVESALASMSLSEKATQLRGTAVGSSTAPQYYDIQRGQDTKTIRGFRFRDGSRGMNLAEDMDGLQPYGAMVSGRKVGLSTVFPVGAARGAAFDLDLEYAIGEAIGDEMQAAKQTVLLAPFVDLLTHPLWGRAQESYGEDPFHIGRLGSAMSVGIQRHIAAGAVHYAGYNVENNRANNNATMDEQTLREIYGRQYRMVIHDGGVAALMTSYNKVNGIKTAANAHTLTDILRGDFGFQGFVLSDWWSLDPGVATSTDSSVLGANALSALRAGLDVEMPWAFDYGMLEDLVIRGALPIETVDRSAARVLEQKFRFNADAFDKVGLGTPRTSYQNGRILNDAEHVALAKKAALESMVLLKNDGNTLPISPSVKKVAVLGAKASYAVADPYGTSASLNFATDVRTGDLGTSRVFHDPSKGVGPFEGIRRAAPAGVTVVNGTNAVDAADADFVVVIAGLTPGDEGEEFTGAGDRMSFELDGKQGQYIQNHLIAAVAALGKPMVVVLEGGSVIDLPWLDTVPALVMAWYPGMVGGEAMGMLLWGQANFSGKLPVTWGRPSDYPPLMSGAGEVSLDYYVGYRRFDKSGVAPLFPFGHGLSYTSFQYKKLQLGCSDMSRGAVLPVVVNVANTGAMAGDEVVMAFVSFPDSQAARRPAKELKGFVRVHLDAGQEKQVTIPIRLSDLDYFQMGSEASTGAWAVESGTVRIMVGVSSATLPLAAEVRVQGYGLATP